MSRRVLGQNSPLCRSAQSLTSGLGPCVEHIENVVRLLGEDDVLPRLEQGLNSIPDIAK